jgi:pimeloyl-ACP methyl ester carboxylesterase
VGREGKGLEEKGLAERRGWVKRKAHVVVSSLLLFVTVLAQAQAALDVPVAHFGSRPFPVGLTKADEGRLRPEETAVIAIHGLGSNQDIWHDLFSSLYDTFRYQYKLYCFSYDSNQSLDTSAIQLANEIQRYSGRGGELEGRSFIIVGHSMGGLVARGYIEDYHGDQRLLRLITLGTPHTGTLVVDQDRMDRTFPGNCLTEGLLTCACVKAAAQDWIGLINAVDFKSQGVKDLLPVNSHPTLPAIAQERYVFFAGEFDLGAECLARLGIDYRTTDGAVPQSSALDLGQNVALRQTFPGVLHTNLYTNHDVLQAVLNEISKLIIEFTTSRGDGGRFNTNEQVSANLWLSRPATVSGSIESIYGQKVSGLMCNRSARM